MLDRGFVLSSEKASSPSESERQRDLELSPAQRRGQQSGARHAVAKKQPQIAVDDAVGYNSSRIHIVQHALLAALDRRAFSKRIRRV